MEVKMIELSFWNFHEQNYDENGLGFGYCLYVVKNGTGCVLYVGISTVDVWERWFGWGGHITWDGNMIYGESSIGEKIEKHIPDSLNWKIQLWTLEDCIKFCRTELSSDIFEKTIHDVEPIMIQKLSPALNDTYNLNPGKDTTPKSPKEKELEEKADRLYKEIFNNKK
jgi:hypothetical protein